MYVRLFFCRSDHILLLALRRIDETKNRLNQMHGKHRPLNGNVRTTNEQDQRTTQTKFKVCTRHICLDVNATVTHEYIACQGY
jgi:hypothetical protein